MARIPRSKLPGGYYHCINRGAKRATIFLDEEDYFAFEKHLIEVAARHSLIIRAYCLMPNHWHIVLECQNAANMSAMFKKLLNWHTKFHHEKYFTIGHGPIYQGRFKSFQIENEELLNTVCRYVEENPLRAGLVSKVGEWLWSSGTIN